MLNFFFLSHPTFFFFLFFLFFSLFFFLFKWRPTRCHFCKKDYFRRDISEHLRNACPMSLMPCKWCDELVVRKKLEQHENVLCDKRIVSCRNDGCKETMEVGVRFMHENERCAFRSIPCGYPGCVMMCMPSQRDEHQLTCPYKVPTFLNFFFFHISQ